MESGIILFFLGVMGVIGAALVGLLSYVVLKLMRDELHLKIEIKSKKPQE
jgi:hypothetical protein